MSLAQKAMATSRGFNCYCQYVMIDLQHVFMNCVNKGLITIVMQENMDRSYKIPLEESKFGHKALSKNSSGFISLAH